MSKNDEEINEKTASYLGKSLRIKIADGRVIQGTFQCLDKDMNIILGSSIEYFGMEDATSDPQELGLSSRRMGSAMIAGLHITSVLIHE